jgi:TolB-like protein/Tfp pilus assembly protein PilF
MPADANRLRALAEAVADGSPIDWDAAESSVDPASVDLVRELRLLASVAEVHRHWPEATTTTPTPASGRTETDTAWGPLRILERLGAGSFGAVYRARDSRLARDVALKLLHNSPSAESASSIIEEGRLLARVRHPHVVSVLGADRFDGRIGIWMELIQGRTLETVLRQDGLFGAREAALIGIDLCGALAAVHAQELVHRDVKAQNVMREEGGRVVLMDFGAGGEAALAVEKHTGTPVYMAPELFDGGRATAQSDIYSLGVLLFRLVTGGYPVEGRTAAEVQAAHARGARRYLRDVRADLPAPFVSAIERALAPDPAARFESGGAMEQALAKAVLPDALMIGNATASPAQTAAGTGEPRAAAQTAKLGRRAIIAIAASLAITLATIAAVVMWRSRTETPAAAVTAQGMRSLAIRPLVNLTGDPNQVYFAAGLTDLLLTHFGSVRALRVIALPSGTASSGQDDAAAFARRAGVEGLFEGSVQRSDGRVRVSARLVSAATNAIVWGRTYEGSEREAFNLQSQIAADVAREIGVSLTSQEARQLTRTYNLSTESQDANLRGRYYLDSDTRPGLQRAREEFEKVVQLEPLYAPAHAGLAQTYLMLGTTGDLTPAEMRKLAPAAAHTALNLDPMLAEAAVAVADVRFRLDWDVPGAEQAYRHAIDLNPSFVFAHCQYARFLAAAGRIEDSLRVAREALRLDPTSGLPHAIVGMALYYSRRYEEAIAHYESRADTGRLAVNIGRGRAFAGLGRYPEAIVALSAAVEISGRDSSVYAELGRTYAAAGQEDRARAILRELYDARGQKSGYIAAQDLAYIHIALGEYETAFQRLDEAIDAQASRLIFLPVDPRIDPIRDDPRFTALVARLHHAR